MNRCLNNNLKGGLKIKIYTSTLFSEIGNTIQTMRGLLMKWLRTLENRL